MNFRQWRHDPETMSIKSEPLAVYELSDQIPLAKPIYGTLLSCSIIAEMNLESFASKHFVLVYYEHMLIIIYR